MLSYSEQHDEFRTNIETQLRNLAGESETISNHTIDPCIKVDEDFMFNLENGRYLTEITPRGLIDNEGYQYTFSIIDTEQLCQLADELL
jgi:hypothetical protein